MSGHTPRFIWHAAKDDLNVRRHGIRFADAARIFDGPTLERVDDRFDYGETRIYAIGLVDGIEVTVIYVDRGEDVRRLIAAWRAEPHERRVYWQSLETDAGHEFEAGARRIRHRGASRIGRRSRRPTNE
jgi:uncharacterized DUF497 family protein